jgi:O-Antigen ligase
MTQALGPARRVGDVWASRPRPSAFALVVVVVSVAAGAAVGAAPLVAVAATLLAAATVLVAVSGLRMLATVALAGAAATFGMNAVRITTFMTFADAFLVVAALALLLDPASWQRIDVGRIRLLFGGFMLIILGGLLGSFFADSAAASVATLLKLVLASVIVVGLFVIWRPSTRELTAIAAIWVGSASVSALVGYANPGPYGRPPGLTTHPNHLGLVCVLAFGPALALAGMSTGFRRLAALGGCAFVTLGVIVSGSRAGILGYCTVLLVAFLCSHRTRAARGLFGARTVIATVLIAGVTAMVLASARVIALPAGNAFDRVLGRTPTVYQSNAERQIALHQGLHRATAHPVTGSGFENALAAHDVYLQMWTAAGVIGVIGFFAIVIGSLAPLTPQRLVPLREVDRAAAALVVGFGASFAGFVAAALFNNALWDRYIWLAPAAIAAAVSQTRPTAETATDLARGR